MTLYWLLVLTILFLLAVTDGKKGRKGILYIIIGLFFVFFAFRVGFTPDYFNYEEYFNRYHSSTVNDNSVEIGFQWLCRVLPSYRVLIILYTALFSVCMYIAVQYYIKGRFWVLAFLILFCHTPFILGNMSGVRSGIVTCLFFISLLLKAKFQAKFFILSLAIMASACMFHRSAIVLMPLLFLPKHPLGNNFKVFFYLLAVIFIIVCLFFGDQLNQITFMITSHVFEDRYEMYSDNYSLTRVNVYLYLKEIIVAVLLFVTLNFTQTEQNVLKNLFIKVTAVSYLFLLAPQGIGLIARFQYYFAFPCIMGISYILMEADKKIRSLYIICLLFLALWELYTLFSGSIGFYTKYQSILF